MDSRIALGIQPLAIPDQSAPLHKALALQALMGQGELQGLQLEEGRRGLRRSAALDALNARNLPEAEHLVELGKIDRSAAIKLQEERLKGLETQGKVNKNNIEQQGSLAQAFSTLPEEMKRAQYPALVQQFNRLLMPGQKPLENEQWNPAFQPNLVKFATAALSPKDAMERGDFAATAVPGAPPAVAALQGQPMPTQPMDVNIPAGGSLDMPGATQAPATVRALQGDTAAPPMPIAQDAPPPVPVMPQTVSAKGPAVAPDDYRKEAQRLMALGTEAASKKAKTYLDEANRMDERIWKERDQQSWKTTGIPGVSHNERTDEYRMNGKLVTAEQQQDIETKLKKAGATNVNVGMNASDAAKAELLNQGISDMAEFKGMLIDKDGKVNRGIIAGMSIPGTTGLPGTDARIAYSLISNAIEAKLRAESGAAVPKEEVTRMADRFVPSPLDSDATIMSKMRRMEAFLRGSFGRIKNAGEPDTKAPDSPKRRASDANAPKTIRFEDLK